MLDYTNEIEVFSNMLLQETYKRVSIEEDGGYFEEELTQVLLDYLLESGNTENAIVCTEIKENSIGSVIHQINGYAISESHDNIDLFITIQMSDSNKSIPKKQFESAIKRVERFFKSAILGHLDEIEETSPVFDFARTLHQVSKDIVRLNIYILSTGKIKQPAPEESDIRGVLRNVYVWDIERFYQLHSSSTQREPIVIDLEKYNSGKIRCIRMPSEESNYDCYVGIIPGELLADLYRSFGSRLLEQNVRSYLQATGKVNKGIRDTIKNEPQMFLAYNNGIAATAESIVLTEKDNQLLINSMKDFQIVNGGQTTASIFYARTKNKYHLDNVYVQMKLTVLKDPEEVNIIIPKISQYSNSQNKVSIVDLTSNNAALIKVEELSRNIWAPDPKGSYNQTRWFFERVRGQYREAINREATDAKKKVFKSKNPSHQKFTKTDLSKVYNTFDEKPHMVTKGAQKNFVDFIKASEKIDIDSVFYENVISKYILFRALERAYGRGENAIGDIRYIVVPYTLSLFNSVTGGKINLLSIWKSQDVDEDFTLAAMLVMKHLNLFIEKNAPRGLIGEWAKKPDCWKNITEHFIKHKSVVALKKFGLSDSEFKKSQKDRGSQTLEENQNVFAQEAIYKLGIRFWDGLIEWNKSEKKLSLPQINGIETIKASLRKKKKIAPHSISLYKYVIDLLDSNSVKTELIQSLSNARAIRKNVAFGDNYKAIKSVSNSDWEKILGLGTQTKKLSFMETSIVKEYLKGKKLSPKQIDIMYKKAYSIGQNFGIISR
jgi:hypothetical protein